MCNHAITDCVIADHIHFGMIECAIVQLQIAFILTQLNMHPFDMIICATMHLTQPNVCPFDTTKC